MMRTTNVFIETIWRHFFGRTILFVLLLCNIFSEVYSQEVRQDISIDEGWQTIADDNSKTAFDGFESFSFNDKSWMKVDVPHNWDAYEGYRRMRHGNRHGFAWYRKFFQMTDRKPGRRYFLFFEGVGSYATIWLNEKKIGYYAGGRTTFTIDVTTVINLDGKPNLLAVRADHPVNIKDLPWVCGGCSDERGFSEGSQPMGIFRPVHLIVTNDIRIEPFGVHIWNDNTISTKSAQLYFETEVKNYSNKSRKITLINRLIDKNGVAVTYTKSEKIIEPGATTIIRQQPSVINNPRLWSLDNPYLYTLISAVTENEKIIDQTKTTYGIRSIDWQLGKSSNQFLLNGKTVFINGIAEYEHLIGKSHAFSGEQIRARAMQMKAAGFNAFRDAHHPHNLRYQHYWDKLGLLWWTQMGAHIWYDSPEFKKNFKLLLKQWVKERRNSPSLVLWGLQNESKLPEDFAKECTELIRRLDPTTSSQRLVTTCNGGAGTDWDVPQNWTGTYGGDPSTYADDVQRQVLIGEYGAWRTLDLHTEGPFVQNGPHSEDRMTQLMELKVSLAESVRDKTAGHFMWLFTSHDNPGRVQGGEGYRELDRVGPVNYKGLLTPWEEPLDVFYMYRSNYAPKEKEPMVYIVSHTWPDRWITPGEKEGIVVYSNCDEVELFNDVRSRSLGKRKKQGVGTHFQWDNTIIDYNVLYAVGYVSGKEVATDYIVLNHLPKAPCFDNFLKSAKPITDPQNNYNYVYRLNCGGADYKDKNGNVWLADRDRTNDTTWGSKSWTNDFPGLPPFFASQRKTNDPIKGTDDWELFQTFRYGREKLRYEFPLPDGEYLIELYFIEPWFGTGGGMDCTGWRLFDVAINNKTVLQDVDVWKEVGHDAALKKTIRRKVTGGLLTLSFPRIASGQAIISAIAIATLNHSVKPASPSPSLIQDFVVTDKANTKEWSAQTWMETGKKQFSNKKIYFRSLPPNLFGAEWIQGPNQIKSSTKNNVAKFKVSKDADVFIALDSLVVQKPDWIKDFENTKDIIENSEGKIFNVFRKRYKSGATVELGQPGIIPDVHALMYTVVVNPATIIEPAYDLKVVTSYKAVNARLKGSVVKTTIDGKERALFENASADNSIEWNFSVGVADTYSLTVSYNNPHVKTIPGKLELFAADGSLMKEEIIELMPTRPGKSNYINSTTGNMINAGNYVLRLNLKDAEGITINSLDVQ